MESASVLAYQNGTEKKCVRTWAVYLTSENSWTLSVFSSGIAKMVVIGGLYPVYVAGVPRVVLLSVTYMESIRWAID